ncbi:MAG: hypothetical protein IKI21_10340 [Oscillospiraceae bacterium]|nr:hypothetical protein [Oscillospiraceae bacterium]
MEEVIVEIPEEDGSGWQPPTIEKRPAGEAPCAGDVFFMQYIVCILLLTAVLVLRLFDREAFAAVAETFRTRTEAPDAAWAAACVQTVAQLWS